MNSWNQFTLVGLNGTMKNALTEKGVRPSTIRDVAREAGVSTATVSRVMNGNCKVSSKSRSTVMTAISKLKFRPNRHATELGRGGSGIPKMLKEPSTERVGEP